MYDITCPYCKHQNHPWEIDGGVNKYMPHKCENCEKVYYILQRSWFDFTYDNSDVEVRKAEWFTKKRKNIEFCGNAIHRQTKEEIPVYRPTDLYDKFGGEEAVIKMHKDLFNIK